MGFEILRVFDQDGWVDDCGERFVGEVTANNVQLILESGGEIRKHRAYVCFRCKARSVVLT